MIAVLRAFNNEYEFLVSYDAEMQNPCGEFMEFDCIDEELFNTFYFLKILNLIKF
jgi:hypothetical protein